MVDTESSDMDVILGGWKGRTLLVWRCSFCDKVCCATSPGLGTVQGTYCTLNALITVLPALAANGADHGYIISLETRHQKSGPSRSEARGGEQHCTRSRKAGRLC